MAIGNRADGRGSNASSGLGDFLSGSTQHQRWIPGDPPAAGTRHTVAMPADIGRWPTDI
jgi:hypothetical protein